MNPSLIKDVLRVCRSDLVADLDPCGGLTDYLYGRNVLTEYDRDNIHAKKTRYEQASEFLDRLGLKGDGVLDQMLAFMKVKGSQPHLVLRLEEETDKILMQRVASEALVGISTSNTASASEIASDFILDYNDAPRITDVLVDDPTLLAGWTMILYKFNLSTLVNDKVESLLEQGKKHGAFLTTLREYISNSGRSATYDALVKIFETRYSAAAGLLKKNKEEIRRSRTRN